MKINRIPLETLLYLLALALALAIRLVNLGVPPLTDSEATWALQALNVAKGVQGALGSQPAYVFLTGLAFYLFGANNFFARFWPALLGGFLVLVPFFFRRLFTGRAGRAAALILAFGLALDPGMIALSRQAGSPMLAAVFSFLAIGLVFVHRPALAGFFGGLALLSGPAFLAGLLGLILAWAASWLLPRNRWPGLLSSPNNGVVNTISSAELKTLAISILITLFSAGTIFFRFPQGLNAWAAGLPAYLAGWGIPSGVPALRLIVGLAIYQPLALIFCLIGILKVWRTPVWEANGSESVGFGRWISLWLVFSLLLAMIYPARQMADLVWVLVPMWALAAIGLASLLAGRADQLQASLGQSVLVFILLALAWLNLAGLSYAEPGVQAFALRLGLMGGVVLLAVLTTVLVALGWSWEVARRGLLWGGVAALGLYVLSGASHLAWFHPVDRPDVQELWSPGPAIGEADLFIKTLGDLSSWHTGRRDAIDLAVAAENPSLRWILRDYSKAQFISSLGSLSRDPAGLLPSVIIAPQSQPAPSLAAAYRGQDFAWLLLPGWTGAFPDDFSRWLVFRQAVVQPEGLILWARSDLFPGGALAPGENSPAAPQNQNPFPLQPTE